MQTVDGRTLRVGAMDLRFLVDESEGSGDLVVFEMTIPAGARVPVAHYHRDVDEVVYGLAGTLTTTVDGVPHSVTAGDSVYIGRGKVHQHENLEADAARALVVLNPGSIGRRYFEEIAQAVGGPGKPDPAILQDIMRRHGLIPA